LRCPAVIDFNARKLTPSGDGSSMSPR
jgi:hypothetical protein